MSQSSMMSPARPTFTKAAAHEGAASSWQVCIATAWICVCTASQFMKVHIPAKWVSDA